MKRSQTLSISLCGVAILLGGLTFHTVGFARNSDKTPRMGRDNPFSLNVRLSSRPIRPPQEVIKQVIPFDGIRAARPRVGPPPLAAIIEDDQRRRIVILSTEERGLLVAYVLENLDLKPYLSEVTRCTQEHHCEEDRMAITGGLGCVAICVKNVLDKLLQP
jgi:hypothetical protein